MGFANVTLLCVYRYWIGRKTFDRFLFWNPRCCYFFFTVISGSPWNWIEGKGNGEARALFTIFDADLGLGLGFVRVCVCVCVWLWIMWINDQHLAWLTRTRIPNNVAGIRFLTSEGLYADRFNSHCANSESLWFISNYIQIRQCGNKGSGGCTEATACWGLVVRRLVCATASRRAALPRLGKTSNFSGNKCSNAWHDYFVNI